MVRLCDWEEIGDDEDVRLNQQGDMIALRLATGETYRTYFDHDTDKAYIAIDPDTHESIKQMVFQIINALGYEPVAVD
jgi:hypothetical protein